MRANRFNAARVFVTVSVLQFMSSASVAEVTYSDIAPILQQRCVMCHSGPAAPRGLHLDSLEGLLAGGDNGVVVNDGDPAASELIRRLQGVSLPRMPMTGPPFLSDEETSLFEEWIVTGMQAGADTNDPVPAEETTASEFVTFDQVAPIFATRCAKCHTDNGLMGAPPEGYRLTSYESVISTADRVRIVPGNPAASELLRRVRGQAQPQMPFDGPPFLEDEEIALIEQWIEEGARNSAGDVAPIPIAARVRLHGTLRTRWQLDDLQLNISPKTRVDGNPQSGDEVRIRGQVQADGSIRVDRVKAR
jgi:uncharacterized membrane protein